MSVPRAATKHLKGQNVGIDRNRESNKKKKPKNALQAPAILYYLKANQDRSGYVFPAPSSAAAIINIVFNQSINHPRRLKKKI